MEWGSVSDIFAALAAVVSGALAYKAIKSSEKTAAAQEKAAAAQLVFQQRQTIIQLWPALCALHEIDASTAPEEVRRAVNTLELVAICYEAGAVDPAVVLRTFGDVFIATYDELNRHTAKLPTVRNMSGSDLLRENKTTMHVYDQIRQKVTALGKVT